MKCRCGATIEHVPDLKTALSRGYGTYGQPFEDGSWLIHVEESLMGLHVPRPDKESLVELRKSLGLT